MNTRMKTASISTIVLLALAMIVGITPIRADDVSCAQTLTCLRDATLLVSISDKDRETLLSKVDEAAEKVFQEKYCDALQKLNDYKAKLVEMLAANTARKVKISEADFGLLNELVNRAIACVQGLAGDTDCGETIATSGE